MTVFELYEKTDLHLHVSSDGLTNEIKGIYVGDLLSNVMAKAKKGNAWITVMGNVNVAAVAVLTEVSCIILADGAVADEFLLKKAESEKIPLFSSKLPAVALILEIDKLLN